MELVQFRERLEWDAICAKSREEWHIETRSLRSVATSPSVRYRDGTSESELSTAVCLLRASTKTSLRPAYRTVPTRSLFSAVALLLLFVLFDALAALMAARTFSALRGTARPRW